MWRSNINIGLPFSRNVSCHSTMPLGMARKKQLSPLIPEDQEKVQQKEINIDNRGSMVDNGVTSEVSPFLSPFQLPISQAIY